MVSVEGLGEGTAYADSFTGDNNANFIFASIGDTVIANGGDDSSSCRAVRRCIDGGASVDTIIRFSGEAGSTLQIDNNGDGLAQFITRDAGRQRRSRVNRIDTTASAIPVIQNVENVGGSTLNDTINGDNTIGNASDRLRRRRLRSPAIAATTLNGGLGTDTLSERRDGTTPPPTLTMTDAMFVDLTAGNSAAVAQQLRPFEHDIVRRLKSHLAALATIR